MVHTSEVRPAAPTVLIADAEPYVCRVFAAKLTKDEQFSVVIASSPVEAFASAQSQPFDAIMWDVRLRDTKTALPHLRALCPDAALLVMTTDDRPFLDAEVGRLDVATILVKPFSLDFLVDMLHHALSIPRMTAPAARLDLACVGQQLSIVTPLGQCVTRVLEVHYDSFAVVGSPRVDTPDDFQPGQEVLVQVRGEDALYSFGSRLLRSGGDPVRRWELEMPESINRHQRRRHPRRSVRLDADLCVYTDAHPPLDMRSAPLVEPTRLMGVTENISLGGAAVAASEQICPGRLVTVCIHNGTNSVTVSGKVVRCCPFTGAKSRDTSGARFLIAVSFDPLTSETRAGLDCLLHV